MNKVILTGNLAKDVDVRYTQSGKAVVKVGLAVTRNFKNAEGERDADFFNLVAWDKKAEIFKKYLHKGSKILVEGRLKNNNYEDSKGVKHYDVDIIVDSVEFMGGGKNSPNKNAADDYEENEDMPF